MKRKIKPLLTGRDKEWNDIWEFYKDKSDEWRWRRKSANGKIVGAGAESYIRRIDCVSNARRNGFDGELDDLRVEW